MKSISCISTAILTLLALFSSICCHAAQWQRSGQVMDNTGEPLVGVVVKMSDSNGKTVAFCSTDSEGNFKLNFTGVPGKDWKVSFAFLGFSTKTLTIDGVKDGMKVVLDEAPLELKEVVVKIPPIKNRGDTLTYDVASFRSKADRNIEDVIKKLPGVDVDDKGGISYNGERINRFYIEGLDVVSGRYTIATRNISPDDILAVDIYENHQPKQVLKDVDFSNKAALNLKMKKKSMLKPIGNVKGGAGGDDNGDMKWLGEGFGMFIAPSMQVLVTAKANNWGNSYSNETRSLITEPGDEASIASKLYGDMPFGSAKIPSERYFDNRAVTASVNTISKTGQYGKLNFTADYTDEDNRTINTESITYTNSEDPAIRFYERVESRPRSQEAKFSMKIEENAPTRFIGDRFSFRGRFADNSYSIFNSGDVRQTSRTDDYNFANTLDMTLRSGRNIVSFNSNIAVVNTPVSRINASGDATSTLVQRGSALAFTTSEKIGYAWTLAGVSTLGVNLNFDSAYDTFKSRFTAGSSGFANDIRGYDLKTVLEPHYTYRPDVRFNVKVQVPLTLTTMKFSDRLTDKKYPVNKTDIGLRTIVNYKPTARFRGSLTLSRNTRLGDIRDFITNPVYTTYRQRTTFGTGLLNESESYSAATNLYFRDPIKAVFITFTGLYRSGHNNRISGSNVSPDEVSSLVANSRNRSDMLNLGLTLSKNVRPWRTTFTLDGNVNSIRRKILRQENPYRVGNIIYSLHGAISSTPFNGAVDLAVSAWYKSSVQKITALGMRSDLNDIIAQGSLSVHPVSAVEIYSQIYWNQATVGQGGTRDCFFLGAGARYHAGHFDLELSGKNLTNSRSYSYSYFSDSDLYSYSFTLRPIEFLVTLKYSF